MKYFDFAIKALIVVFCFMFAFTVLLGLAWFFRGDLQKAHADTVIPTGVHLVSHSDTGSVTKYYDYDNGAVCYSIWFGNGVGISCFKN